MGSAPEVIGISRRAALLAATRRLALSKGLPATTVDEICETAGVTKGSFYYYFGSKDEIGLASLDDYFADLTGALSAGTWAHEPSARARLTAFLAHAAEVSVGPALEHGCLMGSFATDLAARQRPVQAALSTMFATLRDMVASLIAAAAAESGGDVDAAALADQFLAVIEGAVVLAKGHRDPSLPGRIITSYAECLHALLG
jgi:TetR/AcrR family transcriptional repressor of nem operon